MGFFTDNIIPGNHGVIFSTSAKEKEELDRLLEILKAVDGIKDVTYDEEKFPVEVTIHTYKLVNVSELQDRVNKADIHLVPKTLFGLNP